MIKLKHCIVEWVSEGVKTTFADDVATTAWPHVHDPHYAVATRRAGYLDDTMTYCREHDFLHAFLAEELADERSHVLWCSATNETPEPVRAYQEEALVQVFQCWLRADRECLIGEMPYHALRDKARGLLAQ